MSSPLLDLEPKLLWQHFDGIRQVPRPSKHEEKIAEHVEKWAADRGYELLRDAAGSMVIKVPATQAEPPMVAEARCRALNGWVA